MSQTQQDSVEQAATFRMSVGNALAVSAKFYFVIFLVTEFLPLLRSRWANLLDALLIFGLFSVVTAWGMRELMKVSVSPIGIGSRRRPMYWSEITEVERVGGFWFGRGWHVHATYRPTIVVSDSIARAPEFREALERCSPPDGAIREIIAAATD